LTTPQPNPNRAATIRMKEVVMQSVLRNYWYRPDIDSLCITRAIAHTERRQICTVTVDC
ncbi:hypothetical protein DE146DRAFT_589583, partial [Phaeosphaeria sp. MPI-PUGE-AT-0046c]